MTEQSPLLPPPPQAPQLVNPRKNMHLTLLGFVASVLFIAVAIAGITSRAADERSLKRKTQTSAIPTVAVIAAQTGASTEAIVLPGTIQAWHEAIVYARTAGYLKSWNVDIGARVKAGDVLAEIDAPDLDAQFHQAQADLNTAVANNQLAQVTAKRYIELKKTDSVSQQQVDTEVATAQADQATVESEKANLDHLQQQENFKEVIAPFDGTITARNTDIGALINGGNTGTTTSADSATAGQDLFHIADTSKLRVYVQVPENAASAIKPDLTAELHLPQMPQQILSAKLSRTSNALDPTTRSLLIELEVDNADGAIMAGSYTDVHLKIPTPKETILLPVNALLFRDGMHAAVVINDHVALKPVKIGRDYGKTVEIVDGLAANDSIVINPPDSLEDGQEVHIMQPKPGDQSNGKDKSAGQSKSEANYNTQDKGPVEQKSSTNDQPQTSAPPQDQKQGALGQSQNANDPTSQKPMSDQEKSNSQNTK